MRPSPWHYLIERREFSFDFSSHSRTTSLFASTSFVERRFAFSHRSVPSVALIPVKWSIIWNNLLHNRWNPTPSNLRRHWVCPNLVCPIVGPSLRRLLRKRSNDGHPPCPLFSVETIVQSTPTATKAVRTISNECTRPCTRKHRTRPIHCVMLNWPIRLFNLLPVRITVVLIRWVPFPMRWRWTAFLRNKWTMLWNLSMNRNRCHWIIMRRRNSTPPTAWERSISIWRISSSTLNRTIIIVWHSPWISSRAWSIWFLDNWFTHYWSLVIINHRRSTCITPVCTSSVFGIDARSKGKTSIRPLKICSTININLISTLYWISCWSILEPTIRNHSNIDWRCMTCKAIAKCTYVRWPYWNESVTIWPTSAWRISMWTCFWSITSMSCSRSYPFKRRSYISSTQSSRKSRWKHVRTKSKLWRKQSTITTSNRCTMNWHGSIFENWFNSWKRLFCWKTSFIIINNATIWTRTRVRSRRSHRMFSHRWHPTVSSWNPMSMPIYPRFTFGIIPIWITSISWPKAIRRIHQAIRCVTLITNRLSIKVSSFRRSYNIWSRLISSKITGTSSAWWSEYCPIAVHRWSLSAV